MNRKARQLIELREDLRTRWNYKPDAGALVTLAALTLAFLWKIALTNQVLTGLDIFAYFYPYHDFTSEALRTGHIPLWNPHLFMGAPLLANSQAAVLYPLHWPLLWLSVPKQIAWSMVLHVWLAGAGAYLFARRAVRLAPQAALAAAAIFALGGFVGAQVEHINQLNVSAWLPWLLLCLAGSARPGRRRWFWLLLGAGTVGLILLAGHTQSAYIVLFAAGVYAALQGYSELKARRWLSGASGLGLLAIMTTIGLILAAGQLMPTWELSHLSVRGGGLPYSEAASFSLKPGLIFKAFLPPLAWEPPFSEYVAYIGLLGLLLAAVGTWAILSQRQFGGEFLVLALGGVFLALGAYNPIYYVLYKLVPGFDLFRAPSRWLLLYSFGAAILGGIGLEAIAGDTRPIRIVKSSSSSSNSQCSMVKGLWQPLLILLLLVELFIAGRQLAYNHPTSPVAYDSMRSAPAHILANDSDEPYRFLSMSDIRYDPGDLADLQAMYGPYLSETAVYDLAIATKMKEVLAFNLPLHYQLDSVDGYDGGLLPIKDYVTLEGLFLKADEIWPDGRLRQQLRQIPSSRLLSLLNVKYVITDKSQDAWIDGVFYDLEHTVPLGNVTLSDLPDFQSTQIGVVSYLTGTADLPDGTPVAKLTVTSTSKIAMNVIMRAGEHTAEAMYEDQPVSHRQAQIGHAWRDSEGGNDYIAVVSLGQKMAPEVIRIESLLATGQLHLRGISLIDDQDNTSRILSIDPAYRLVHSGDVKIYQNLAMLPRAFVTHQARVLRDIQDELALLSDPAFDPSVEVILAEGSALMASEDECTEVQISTYEPELIQVETSMGSPGYLVLTDTHYPGWFAEVDGQPTPILRADIYFRAVALAAGDHQVTFRYQPAIVQAGLRISLAAWLLWATTLAVMARPIGRNDASGV